MCSQHENKKPSAEPPELVYHCAFWALICVVVGVFTADAAIANQRWWLLLVPITCLLFVYVCVRIAVDVIRQHNYNASRLKKH